LTSLVGRFGIIFEDRLPNKESSGFAAGIKTSTLFGTASFFQSFYSTATQAVIVASIDLLLPFSSCLVVVSYNWFLTSIIGCFGIIFDDRLPTERILWIYCWHKNQHLVCTASFIPKLLFDCYSSCQYCFNQLVAPFSSCLVVVGNNRILTSVVGCFGIIFDDCLPTERILWINCWHKNQHLVWHRLFYSEASI
jgi:hypothetical protein